MKLSKEQAFAFEEWMKVEGHNLTTAGDALGVKHTTIRRWLIGESSIRPTYIPKVLKVIEPYLIKGRVEKEIGLPKRYSEIIENLRSLIGSSQEEKVVQMIEAQVYGAVSLAKIIDLPVIALQEAAPIKATKPSKVTYEFPALSEFKALGEIGEVHQAAAGFGRIIQEIDPNKVQIEGLEHRKDITLIEVVGESMSPTLENGEFVIVRRFPTPMHFGEGHLSLNAFQVLIGKQELVLFEQPSRFEGLSIKRLNYQGSNDEWGLYLNPDNKEWKKENHFNTLVKKSDDLVIHGIIIGKAKTGE